MRKKIRKKIFCVGMASVMAVSTLNGIETTEVSAADGQKESKVSYEPMEVAAGFNADVVATKHLTLRNPMEDDDWNDAELLRETYHWTKAVDKADDVGQSRFACFYTKDVDAAEGYLPDDGVVRSQTTDGLFWQLADYTSDNVLKLGKENTAQGIAPTGTLTFKRPGCYQRVHFLVTAAGASQMDAKVNTTVTYADGSQDERSFTIYDWYATPENAIATAAYKRYKGHGWEDEPDTENPGQTIGVEHDAEPDGSTTGGPYFAQCEMPVFTTKLVKSVEIRLTGELDDYSFLCIYGVTGESANIAAPTVPATEKTAEAPTSFKAVWNEVDDPDVKGYTLDVATDKDFANILDGYLRYSVGNVTEAEITGLEPNTTYYYRVRSLDGEDANDENTGRSLSSPIVKVNPKTYTVTVPENAGYMIGNISASPAKYNGTYEFKLTANTGYELDKVQVSAGKAAVQLSDQTKNGVTVKITGITEDITCGITGVYNAALADARTAAKSEIDDDAAKVKAEIDKNENLTDDKKNDYKTQIDNAAKDGKDNVDKANTQDDVDAAKKGAADAFTGIKDLAVKEDLADAKIAAKGEVDQAASDVDKKIDGLSKADEQQKSDWKKKVEEKAGSGKTNIDTADTTEGVIAAKDAAVKDINSTLKEIAEELINSIGDGDSDEEHKKKIEAAEEILDNLGDGEDISQDVKDKLEAEKLNEYKRTAKAEVDAAAEHVKGRIDKLDAQKIGESQIAASKAEADSKAAAGKTEIDKAATKEAVDAAKKKAIDEINAIRVEMTRQLIDAIGEVKYDGESKKKIEAAEDSFTKLTQAEQEELSEEAQKLKDAKKEYEDLEVEAIGLPKFKENAKAEVQQAGETMKNRIDALGEKVADEKKETWKNKIGDKVTAGENAIDAAESAQGVRDERDKAIADINSMLIEMAKELIGEIGDVKADEESRQKIDAAREIVDKLRDDEKEKIPEEIKELEDAESKYRELEKNKLDAEKGAAKAEVKAAADEVKSRIDGLKNPTDEQKTAWAEIVDTKNEAGGKAIDAANDSEGVKKAKDEAIANIKHTLVEIAEDLIKNLDGIKDDEESKKKIDTAREIFDGLTPEEKEELPEGTEKKLTDAEDAYNKLKSESESLAKAKEEACEAVDAAAAAMKGKITGLTKATEDQKSAWQERVSQKAVTGKNNINDAITIDGVDVAKVAAIADINNTLFEIARELLDDIKDTDSEEERRQKVDEVKEILDQLDDKDKENIPEDIKNKLQEEEEKLQDPLKDEKDAAKEEVKTAADEMKEKIDALTEPATDKQKEDWKKKVDDKVTAGEEKIDQADTKEKVDEAKNETVGSIDDTFKEIAKDLLDDIKNTEDEEERKKKIEDAKDILDQLDPENKDKDLTDIKNQIEEAGKKPNSQENLKSDKEAAKKAVDDAVNDANKKIDAFDNITDEQKKEWKADVAAKAEEGKKAIDAAKDSAGVESAKNNAIAAMQKMMTDINALKIAFAGTISLKELENLIFNTNTDKADPANTEFSKLRLKAVGAKKSVKLSWTKVKGASGYIIYGSECGKQMQKLGEVTGNKKKFTAKKLKKGKYYKYIVSAYKVVNGEKRIMTTARSVHAVTKGGKYGNPKKVIFKKSKLTIKAGKSKKLKPKMKSTAKVRVHIAKFRYESTNPSVVTVDKKGKLKASGKGTCYVYIYTQNGYFKRIKVKVK